MSTFSGKSNIAAAGNHPQLQDKEFLAFRELLYKESGIYLPDSKRSLVAGRLASRLRLLQCNTYHDYYRIIAGQVRDFPNYQAEKHKAVDLLTTNETFFCREQSHFDFIVEKVLPQYRNKTLHCWSAASSTGEEAYTLAMTLFEHHHGDFDILGTDINDEVVAKARSATYALKDSQKIPRHLLQKYCLKGTGSKANTFKFSPKVRRVCRFMEANLMSLPTNLGKFDIVFIRNVMIYFNHESKVRVMRNVIDRLNPNGWVILSHAETLNGVTNELKPIIPSVYQKPASRHE